jgi:hypothetical protein
MLARLRARLTYANVVATLALFLALGGVSYAAIRVGTGSIINNSVRTQDLRNNDIRSKDIRNRAIQHADILTNTILGQQVRESTLSKVPDADKLDGQDSTAFKQRCPAETTKALGVCIENNSRGQSQYEPARQSCSAAGGRMPTYYELDYVRNTPSFGWANGQNNQNEFTSDVDNFTSGGGGPTVIALDRNGNGGAFTQASASQYYRCVIYPSDS